MYKEICITKNQHSSGSPLSKKIEDRKAEDAALIRQILVIIANTLILSTGLLNLSLAVYVLTTKTNVIMLTHSYLITECCSLVLFSILLGFLSVVLFTVRLRQSSSVPFSVIVTALASLSMLMVVTSSAVAAKFRGKMIFKHVTGNVLPKHHRLPTLDLILTESHFKDLLISFLGAAMKRYRLQIEWQAAFDSLQMDLQCRGIEKTWEDWMTYHGYIPTSCFRNGYDGCNNSSEGIHLSNCVDAVSMDLASMASLLAGFGSIFLLAIFYATLVACVLLWQAIRGTEKKRPESELMLALQYKGDISYKLFPVEPINC